MGSPICAFRKNVKSGSPYFFNSTWHITLLRVFIFILLFSHSLIAASQLPLGHWGYDFLERMEAEGVICRVRDGSRPFSRAKVAKYVVEIDEAFRQNPDLLTKVEADRLERLKGELSDELKSTAIKIEREEKEPHLYSWQSQGQTAHFDVLTGGNLLKRGDDAPVSEQSIYSGYYGGILRIHAWGVDAYSDNRILSEWGSRTYLQHYNASAGYPIGTSRDSSQATWDRSNSYLGYEYKGLRLLWGRDNVAWGPSKFGGLMISGQAPEFDMLKCVVDFGNTRFTWLHGELRSDFEHKWLASHRFEISFLKSLDVGFHETVIYGNRGMEIAYLNPVLPYLISEHTLGDHDNVTMGLDVDYHPGNGLKLYGDFFIDDLFAPWEVFDNYWGNKLAFTLGAFWVNPVPGLTSDFRMEYSRIEPYVYTHEDSVNVFEHYDQGIGSVLQPNSDQVNVSFRYYPSVDWTLGIHLSQTRHGEGDRRKPHQDWEGEKKHFLQGLVEKSQTFHLFCQYEYKRDLFFVLRAGYEKTENYEQIEGNDLGWPEVQLGFQLNW